jgi:DNA-binding SARP family transcriptional activator
MTEHRRRLAEALHEAIACAEAVDDDPSLAHLLAASRAVRDSSDAAAVLVDLISGRVVGREGSLPLTRAELAVVFLLAVFEYGLSGDEIADALYPEADALNGANAVKVGIYRARRRIGVPGAIRQRASRYVLGETVDVELRGIERQCRTWRALPALDRTARDGLGAARLRLAASRPAFMQQWGWFEATERRLRDLYRDVTMALARDALRAGRLEHAIELARELADRDPLDEEAAELGIRAFLRLGDRTSALLAYRRYAFHIRHELSLSPPQAMSALLG